MDDFSIETTSNEILAGLDAGERERLGKHLTYHHMKLGEPIFDPDDTIDFLLFPNHSMASVVGRTSQGNSAGQPRLEARGCSLRERRGDRVYVRRRTVHWPRR